MMIGYMDWICERVTRSTRSRPRRVSCFGAGGGVERGNAQSEKMACAQCRLTGIVGLTFGNSDRHDLAK